MPRQIAPIPLAAQAYARAGLPGAELLNLYVEATPNGPTESARFARPGLVSNQTVGFGPIRGIKTHQGARFVISGTRAYKDGVLSGILPGSGLVRTAELDTQLVTAADSTAYLVDTMVTPIAMPDGDPVLDVVEAAGRMLYLIAGTGKYRYSDIGDVTSIPGLAFASAEAAPDNLVAGTTLGDQVVLFGQYTTEFHYPTGDINAPFVRSQGQRYDKGCAAQNSIVLLDNGLFWVGTSQVNGRTDLAVYKTGGVPVVVSTHAIESLLSQCADITQASAFAAAADGHQFYVLNIPGVATVAYDVTAPRGAEWARWGSYGQDTFRVQCAEGGLYGDNDDATIWTLDGTAYLDGTDPIQRVVSAYIPAMERQRLNKLSLLCARGVGAPATSPVVEMRYSDHEGQDFSAWREGPLGAAGASPQAIWRQLGQFYAPGRLFQFRCSDPVAFTPYGVLAE